MHIHHFAGSSTINHIAFDEAESMLTVMFQDGGSYIYFDVPSAVYRAFCNASSPGAFLNDTIKGRFRFSFDPARRRFGPKANP